MINTLLSLTRPLIVLDTETTGVDTENDRIVELGFQVWTAEGMQKEWRSLINPGIPIPAEVTEVHHITDRDVKGCQTCGGQQNDSIPDWVVCSCAAFKSAPFFKQIAGSLAFGFFNCDFAGKNVRFDLRIIAAEMARANTPWSYSGARIVDAERLEQLAVPRSLSHLHEKYTGHKHDGAHGALSDVRASTTVIVHQLKMYQTLPRDLDALHAAQWPGWIDSEGKFKFKNGVPHFGNWGKYKNQPMKNAGNGYWDFIISKDFSAEIKAIARAAKVGQLPLELTPMAGPSEMRRDRER